MRTVAVLVIIAFLSCAAKAEACSYPPPPSLGKSIATAKSAFVFQVVSASLERDATTGETLSNRVVAKIRITEVLKGKPEFVLVTFSNSWCGGNRLDVGHYFVAASSQSGTTLRLVPADRSVLDVTRSYREHDPKATNNAKVIPSIRNALLGQPLPARFPSQEQLDLTQTVATPPPPPQR